MAFPISFGLDKLRSYPTLHLKVTIRRFTQLDIWSISDDFIYL